MMHAAPAAPSAPAIVAVISPAGVEPRQPALGRERGDRDDHADQEVGDPDAQQRLQRVPELRLSLVQQRAVHAPRQDRSGDEDDPNHSFPRMRRVVCGCSHRCSIRSAIVAHDRKSWLIHCPERQRGDVLHEHLRPEMVGSPQVALSATCRSRTVSKPFGPTRATISSASSFSDEQESPARRSPHWCLPRRAPPHRLSRFGVEREELSAVLVRQATRCRGR